MIKKLRTKFIIITAVALLSVICVIVVAIMLVNSRKNVVELDERIDMVFRNSGEMPDFRDKEEIRPLPREEERDYMIMPSRNDSYKKNFSDMARFGTVKIGKNGKIKSINTDMISSLSTSDMKVYAKKIIKKNKERGWISEYRYKYNASDDGYLIIVMNGAFVKDANYSVAITTTVVAAVAYAVVLLIILLVSNKVIQPISDSYDKQRQFITDASHELKTPLTIIMANAEILELTDEDNEWIIGIKKQTEKMKDLVNSMVALNRLDEDSTTVLKEKFDLSDAVYETAKVFESVCKRKDMSLNINVDEGIEYSGDESAMRQLVSVLMDNAVKYCDNKGEIDVNLTKGKNIWLSISNDYEQVEKAKLDRLFDRFYRVDKARVRNGSYGLGLSIARMIVQKHNGYLKVKNIDNKRIEFIITLKP